MITVTTKLIEKGDLKAQLEKLAKAFAGGPHSVKVGLPSGAASGGIIAYAVYNHEGTSRGIPPRPFISKAMLEGRAQIRTAMRNEARDIMNGKSTPARSMERIGQLGQGLVKKKIISNMPPPNAPSTIRQKGSSGTLRGKTGDLLKSITYQVE